MKLRFFRTGLGAAATVLTHRQWPEQSVSIMHHLLPPELVGPGLLPRLIPNRKQPPSLIGSLTSKHIPFTEDSLHEILGINTPPPIKEEDAYEQAVVKAILTPEAQGWQRMIVCNMQPIRHHTTFSMNMALLIYTPMVGRRIYLTYIMRDFMYHATEGPSDQRLPFPVLITRLSAAFEVALSPEDEYLTILGKDRDCPFGDCRGEKKKARKCDIEQPPPPLIPSPLGHPQFPQNPPPTLATNIPTSSFA
ncbi:hypothetical protein PIB30_072776 [Stylosanthes scabra]|uniref:Putative plant transposon protein domain-containing protein n=1 Tax=Stylosanthes scabra TaxID=79078 RepID=A0ABU6QNS5_9FABA|nr:hypothetical protein [Stylosanthes scabra]